MASAAMARSMMRETIVRNSSFCSTAPLRCPLPEPRRASWKAASPSADSQVAAKKRLERLAGILDLLGGAGEIGQVLEAPADDGGQQRFFGREVAVQGT
jgi:hypothetical protein